MSSPDRKLNEAARDLATAILVAGHLKGEARTQVGVQLEKQLKRFAETVTRRANEDKTEKPNQ